MASTTLTQKISLNLTRDELLALLQLMGSSTMNGLPEDPFAGASEQERTERLNAGLETLLNRGLVEAQGADSLVIDDTLVALVGSCVIPDASLVLSALQPDGTASPRFLNATPEILVEHSSPRAGIHTFAFLPDEDSLADRVRAFFAPIASATSATTFSITAPDQLIADVFRWSRNKLTSQAMKGLIDAKWPTGEAEAFVRSCQDFPIYTGLCAWGLRREQPEGSQTLIAVSDQQRCWLLEPQGQREDRLRVRSMTGDECAAVFVQMAQHLVHAASAR